AAGDAARRRVGLHLRVRRGARVGDAAAHAERAAPQGRPALHARRRRGVRAVAAHVVAGPDGPRGRGVPPALHRLLTGGEPRPRPRSEEHTSELQSRENLVCRLLLEKKKKQTFRMTRYYKTN